MNSHDLARLLLSLPDLPMATGNLYMSEADRLSHGPLEVGLVHTYAGDHIAVGSMLRLTFSNRPNWYLKRLFRERGL